MRFISFELNDVLIRTKGSVGILTAAVRSAAVRDGVEIKTHARQLAILSEENERITISHFDTVEVCGSSPHGPTISFSELESTTSPGEAPIGSIKEAVQNKRGDFIIFLGQDNCPLLSLY
jgi:hypothetical protein